MSQINVNRIKDSNEGAPDFPSGVNVSGVTSTVTLGVTNLNPTNVNVSGVVTATTLDGNLLATGTPTLGLGVTINASGLNISGVATAGIVSATTLYGDGANITGIALSIAPLNYNPAAYGVDVGRSNGIGFTFNQAVKAGSGNVTLRLVGAAGTVVENFGVGNSVSYSNGDTITIDPTSDLSADTVYHISYPSGAFTNIGGDVSYVGTGYTFDTESIQNELFAWGTNGAGQLGQNNIISYSSPIQIPGGTWRTVSPTSGTATQEFIAVTKTDGTLWTWGQNTDGQLGQNDRTQYSSPVQIPGTTWSPVLATGGKEVIATKTDGTLWSWGYNNYGQLGINDVARHSSPVQIPGTDWPISGKNKLALSPQVGMAVKTNGELWVWGRNGIGYLGQNQGPAQLDYRSSPVQIPGTTWSSVGNGPTGLQLATRTDGTLWSWGYAAAPGQLGLNDKTHRSSPTQIPGTTWSTTSGGYYCASAMRTDNTLWTWGISNNGVLGQNSIVKYSSPVQIPGTTWNQNTIGGVYFQMAIRTDGTLWSWGYSGGGVLGLNQANVKYSSPVQIPGTTWSTDNNVIGAGYYSTFAIRKA